MKAATGAVERSGDQVSQGVRGSKWGSDAQIAGTAYAIRSPCGMSSSEGVDRSGVVIFGC